MEMHCPSPDGGLSSYPLGSHSAACFGHVWWGGGWREREARQGLSTAASHRIEILSPSPITWLNSYLSHKRDEVRAAREGSGLLT